ncbi:MAG: Gfo/Idh/MocA family oxidoreductase [Planctomycetaceae bacterium]
MKKSLASLGTSRSISRRRMLTTSGAAALTVAAGDWFTEGLFSSRRAIGQESKNDRPRIGCIGTGGQGTYIGERAKNYGDIVAVCDVQRQHAERAKERFGGKADIYEDYNELLKRSDIDAVTIGTPDHWHTAPVLAALKAGKHIYCEKPLTLTIDEGKLIVAAVKESGKTFQVGTMQRTDMPQFARAVATARSGQLGKILRVDVVLPGPAPAGGPYENKPVPDGLNWDRWLGQTPLVEYCTERCHGSFRWWFEYSGGMMTDWGAHYVDIAHWALDCEESGPLAIDGSATKLPNIPNGYNTPTDYSVDMMYPHDVNVKITSGGDHGVLITGEKGRIFVDRGKITGKPIEEQDADEGLKSKILDSATALFKGNTARMGDHMGNFFEAFLHGKHPVSDVVSQHRVVSACHLANISIRLGRAINWDSAKEMITGDDEANTWLSREQREGYRIG